MDIYIDSAGAWQVDFGGRPITLGFSPPSADGGRAVEYVASEREADPPAVRIGISGAYGVMDRDGRFLVARARAVEAIALARRFNLPDAAFCGRDDPVVGMTLTCDGRVAFVTERGVVGTLPRDPAQMCAETPRSSGHDRTAIESAKPDE